MYISIYMYTRYREREREKKEEKILIYDISIVAVSNKKAVELGGCHVTTAYTYKITYSNHAYIMGFYENF